nr:hypothetical protein [Tanacetum cinerariifolium]
VADRVALFSCVSFTLLTSYSLLPYYITKDEEPTEDEEEDEHLAMADSSTIPVVDHVPSAGDTETFETDESAPTPRSPQTKILFSQTRLRRARKTVRIEPPMSASIEAHNAPSAVTYTSISSDSDGPSWGIPFMNAGELSKMDPYEEVAQQGQAPPLSPAYVPDPMELDEHVEDQPYVDDASPIAESPRHISNSDLMEEDSIDYPDEPEDDDEDPEEDHTDYPADGGDDDDDD